MRAQPRTLRQADIASNAISYHLLGWSLAIVTIPLLPFVWPYYRRYFSTLHNEFGTVMDPELPPDAQPIGIDRVR